MLIIRPEQMLALSNAQKERFTATLTGELQATHPAELSALGPAEVRALIDAGVDRACAHGFDTESGIRRYVAFMIARGLGFEDRPDHAWAKAVLARTDSPGDTRVDQLEKMAALLGAG